jgi:hypothetical protein
MKILKLHLLTKRKIYLKMLKLWKRKMVRMLQVLRKRNSNEDGKDSSGPREEKEENRKDSSDPKQR